MRSTSIPILTCKVAATRNNPSNLMALQNTTISVAQANIDGRWYMLLDYEDGAQYVSQESFDTEAEAEQAACSWALQNHVEEGRAN
jgi:hypothetical protein